MDVSISRKRNTHTYSEEQVWIFLFLRDKYSHLFLGTGVRFHQNGGCKIYAAMVRVDLWDIKSEMIDNHT